MLKVTLVLKVIKDNQEMPQLVLKVIRDIKVQQVLKVIKET